MDARPKKRRKPANRPQATYEDIVAKYIRKGFHPLSAKAQADIWQQRQTFLTRRRHRRATHG